MRLSIQSVIAVGAVCASAAQLCGCQPRRATPVNAVTARAADAASAIFTDALPDSGIDFAIHQTRTPITIRESVGHGAALIDYDGDGLPDIVFLGPDAAKIYHNDGNWRFTDVTAKMGLRQPGYWQGVAVGDYDNDGYPDLYVCGYNCSALYHNAHGRRFTEVTREAGLEVGPPDAKGNPEWRTSAAFVDVNQDGKLDLFACRYAQFGPNTIQLCATPNGKVSCSPEMYKGQKGSLYMNLGGGRFRDETQARGLNTLSGRDLGIAIGDYNGDGKIDLAVANDELPGNLYANKGNGYFQDTSLSSGTAYDRVGKTHGGMGIDWGDMDNDGKLDLFLTTYEKEPKNLYKNLKDGVFLDISEQAGLMFTMAPWVGWGCKFLDYDDDGLLDIFMTSGHVMDNAEILGKGSRYRQPMQLFHNEGHDRFTEVSARAGPAFKTEIVGRAACLGDLDNDGKQDLVVTNIEGRPLLLRGVFPMQNHWLGLQLIGKQSNRMGIGSEVRAETGSLHLMQTCTTTGSVLSAHDPRVYFGLGPNATAQRVTIRWPSGKVDTFTDVAGDRYWVATEGSKTLAPASYSSAGVKSASAR
jgi:hypothetical protein